MKIQVRYFASVREQLGASEVVSLDALDGGLAPATVGELRDWLMGLSPAHAEALDHARSLRMALNQTLCGAGQPLVDGAEVAFFPPVTGG